MRPPLSKDQKRRLLFLARSTVHEVVVQGNLPNVPREEGRLAEPAGAFVTLLLSGRLRGCVGLSSSQLPLTETIVQAALGAALHDPRFSPVTTAELPEITIEISVLSEPSAIAAEAVKIGEHGLLVVRGRNRGLLLPQVAAERSWHTEQFLEEACRKAGLLPGAWREPETEVLAFTAEVFSDDEGGLQGEPSKS